MCEPLFPLASISGGETWPRHDHDPDIYLSMIVSRECLDATLQPQTLRFKSQLASAATFHSKPLVVIPSLPSLPPLFIYEIFVVYSPDFDRAHLVAPSPFSSTLVSRWPYLWFHFWVLDLPPLDLWFFWFSIIKLNCLFSEFFWDFIARTLRNLSGKMIVLGQDRVSNPSTIGSFHLWRCRGMSMIVSSRRTHTLCSSYNCVLPVFFVSCTNCTRFFYR